MTKAIETWVEKNTDKFKSPSEQEHLIEFLMENFGQKNSINFNYEDCVQKAEQWIRDLNEKTNRKNVGQTKTVMTLKDGFFVVQLLDQAAKEYEGLEMGHCVAHIGYEPKTIFSLRDSNKNPHCTFEIQNQFLLQLKGKQNRPVLSKYVPYVLEFLKSKKLKATADLERSLKSLGFDTFDGKETITIKSYFSNLYEISGFMSLENSSLKIPLSNFSTSPKPENQSFLSRFFNRNNYIEDIVKFLNIGAHPEVYQFIEDHKLQVTPPKPKMRNYEKLLSQNKPLAIELLKKYHVLFEEQCDMVKLLLNYSLKKEAIEFLRSCGDIPSPSQITGYDSELDDLIIEKIMNNDVTGGDDRRGRSGRSSAYLSSCFNQRMTEEIFQKLVKANPNLRVDDMLYVACLGQFDPEIIFTNMKIDQESLDTAARMLINYFANMQNKRYYPYIHGLDKKIMKLINMGAVVKLNKEDKIRLSCMPESHEILAALKLPQLDDSYSINIQREDGKETVSFQKSFSSKEERVKFVALLEQFLSEDETAPPVIP